MNNDKLGDRMNLREVEPKFRSGEGVFRQLWRVELDLLWQRKGVIREVKGYSKPQKTDMAGIMNNNNSHVSSFLLAQLKTTTTDNKNNTSQVITPFVFDFKHGEKMVQTVKTRAWFNRHKKFITGKTLRKKGFTWIKLNSGIYTPIVHNKKYPISAITGLIPEQIIPLPW